MILINSKFSEKFHLLATTTLLLCMLIPSLVFAKACVVELKIPQLKIVNKSCFQNMGMPIKNFNILCDAQRNQPNVTVVDLKMCPKGALAFCYTAYPLGSGGFRTYTYSRASVNSLKISCQSKSPGMPKGQWTLLKP